MNLLLSKTKIVKSKSLKKSIAILYALSIIILLAIINYQLTQPLNFASKNPISTNFEVISTHRIIANLNLLMPYILLLGILTISLASFGVFTKTNPRSLAEILSSSNFDIQIKHADNNNETGIIKLAKCSILITWYRTSGQFYTWTLLIKLVNDDSSARSSFEHFSNLLCMEKDKSDNSSYKKIIPVRDWPRQEFLIHYWLEGLNL